ncbi:hypothetical protein C0Q70_04395 [Pomacea canaliculata]|uniref:BAG domain-containing protein n=1 Tax=Pomacea canaliculata TaxID=400727 RepID=A0A2T7PVD8_POMCA|nr:hypothetical protein C0Q70_04395 [Pomacea canaliculata]
MTNAVQCQEDVHRQPLTTRKVNDLCTHCVDTTQPHSHDMAALTQNTRSVLSEVETFLVETLKSVKLSKTIQDQRDRLVEKITRLLEEIPGSGAIAS